MEAVKLVVVFLVVVLFQVMGAFSAPLSNQEQDADVWTVDSWQRVPQGRGLKMRLAEIIKRSKGLQFHGLMGRSSEATRAVTLDRKREYLNAQKNKGEVFVGLMGRRNLEGESKEWDMY